MCGWDVWEGGVGLEAVSLASLACNVPTVSVLLHFHISTIMCKCVKKNTMS